MHEIETSNKNSPERLIDWVPLALNSQDGLIFLRSAFSAPKVLHFLRWSPSVSHTLLEKSDALLRRPIQLITNSNLNVSQWLQASLPVRDGGL